jgi:diaminohydroxyphosphoribosylaminopyrimidine deaminase/5-amino-6-(5-phosphoribosylamino)uracil reductase
MMRAIELADKGSGYVSPNPKVGAVIVKNSKIISEGWHSKYGAIHAEVDAITKSGIDNFEGCTIYVNLEPCSHYGKTPPCADLIIEKKFSQVVIGSRDPNPLVAGKGIEKLRNTGIEVITDVCKEECDWLNRIFFKHITLQKPYIMMKIAQSLDGCIALKNGESKWISSEESRNKSHKLRSEFDAVLVGKNTITKDNSLLNVRSVEGRNPYRVICDTNLSLALDLKILKLEDKSRTIICCSEMESKSRKARNLSLSGVNIVPVETNESGQLDLNNLISALHDNFDITSIMVEGGAGIYTSFLKYGLIDEMQVFIAPKIVGTGRSAFDVLMLNKMSQAYQFKLKYITESGGDIHSIYLNN